MNKLKQFRMTNGDEILCQLIEEAEEEGCLLVNRILRIIATDDFETSIRYYSFKPWVSFQDDFDQIVILNVAHIVSETDPSATLQAHFTVANKEVRESQGNRKTLDVDKVMKDTAGMSEDEIFDYMESTVLEMEQQEEDAIRNSSDSSDGNIINFPPKGTMH